MDSIAMAPKTRQLAQAKRKKGHRRPPANKTTSPARVRTSNPAAPVPADSTEGDVLAVPRVDPDQAIGSKVPVRQTTPRRSTTAQRTRPYQARNRSGSITNPDAQRATALPREVEYAFIRSDMRRLLLTAGTLAILMILLLVLLEP